VTKKNVELVTLLLKRGANVNRKYTVATESGKLVRLSPPNPPPLVLGLITCFVLL
jgi:hypothetical protein